MRLPFDHACSRALLAASCLALISSALACGGDDSATGSAAATSSSGAGGGGGGSQQIECTEPASLSLSGTWGAYGRLSVTLQGAPGGAITICPTDQVGEANLLVMITVDQDTTDPTKLSAVKATLCGLELPVVTALVGMCDPMSDNLVSTQLVAPQAFLDALPKIATTPVTGTLSAAEVGATLSLDRLKVTIGSTKEGGDMPGWDVATQSCNDVSVGRSKTCEMTCVADCASLRDDDADGYPGVTIDVCGVTNSDVSNGVACNADMPNEPGATLQGRGFIDIQVDPQLTGVAKSSCEMTGTVDSSVIYNLVGADVYLAGAQIGVSSAIKSLPAFQVSPTESKFRMVRVDGQYGAPDLAIDPTQPSAACATLVANVNLLK